MPPSIPPIVSPGTLIRGPQPLIEGDGLALRPFTLEDAPVIVDAFGDAAIRLWHRRSMDSLHEAEMWIAETSSRWQAEEAGNWAIIGAGSGVGEVVGRISLSRIDLAGGRGEISYWVLPQHRGRGVATRSVVALTGWALGSVGFHRLELNHSTANPASCRVAEGARFSAEGTARSALLHADGWHDMHLHARIAPEA